MKILVLENSARDVEKMLSELGDPFAYDVVYDGSEAVYLSEFNDYDALVVSSDIDFCKEVRKEKIITPILFISAIKEINYLATLIESGVDDYLLEPFVGTEFCAKIKSLVRRFRELPYSNIFRRGGLTIDFKGESVMVKGKPINLKKREYEVLEYLILNKNRVLSKDRIFAHVWGESSIVLSNTVEVHIKRLRDKIEKPCNKTFIETIRGQGYKFVG
jgi:DNA-binding response OmpR family regulator